MDFSAITKDFTINQAKEMERAIAEGNAILKEGKPYCPKCGDNLLHGCPPNFCFFRCQKCDPVYLKEKEKDKEKLEKEKREAIENAKRECFIDSTKAFAQTFENDKQCNEKANTELKKYIKNFSYFQERGVGLLLFGGTGTGKTFLARATLHRLIEKEKRAKEIKIIYAYNNVCHNAEKRISFIKDLLRCDVVLIDDIGAERTNESIIEFMYEIVDRLYESQVPVIYTTNLAFDNFVNTDKNTMLGRVYSRIGGSTYPIEINNENSRTKEMKETIKTVKQMQL